MTNKEQIKELLGYGLPQNVVATATGTSETEVSLLLADEVFAEEVQHLKIQNLTEAAGRDRKYNSIEDELLDKLKEKLESGLMFNNAKEILAALRIVNSAVRRGAPAELGHVGSIAKQTVNLVLPENAAFAAKFVVNGNNQVLEIAGRPLATMGAKTVTKKLDELQKNRNAKTHETQQDQDKKDAGTTLKNLLSLPHLPVAETL